MERAEKVAIEQSENTLVELHDFQSFPMTLSVRGDRVDVVGHPARLADEEGPLRDDDPRL